MGDEDGEPDESGADPEERPAESRGRRTDTDRAETDRTGNDVDDKLVGTEPDPEAIDEPTSDSAQASRETRWALQEGLAIGLISIASVLLLAFGLMQATGLVSLPGPLEDSPLAHWTVFIALAVALVVVFAYSQRGT